MAFKISPFHMEANGSPFERRDKSKKEVRLSKKLEKQKTKNKMLGKKLQVILVKNLIKNKIAKKEKF